MKTFVCFLWITVLLALSPSIASEFYVAPDGNDANTGTIDHPFASIMHAQGIVSPGDTVWIRGGEYVFSGTEIQIGILLNKSGEKEKRIKYWAYQNEIPVFDFYKLATQVRIKGISVTGNWLHLKGIEVRGVQQILTRTNESWAIRVEGGSHNIFERLNLHHNEGPGLFIADGGDNLVLNCDSHHNYDPDRRGENADGFGGHSNDDGNIFRGCRAWSNSDDGFDLINAPGVHIIENCWAWHNGFILDTSERAGNGAGVKSGGFLLDPTKFPPKIPVHIIRFNLSFDNRAQGFYANYHPGPLHFFNNTAYGNPRNFDMQTVVDPVVHILRNNIAYGSGAALANITKSVPDDKFNSWNIETRVTDADFISLMPEGMDSHRQADGSLPRLNFMRLSKTSRLIDAGVDVGLPYHGKAPDIGAFETE
ncbi:MAG: right-handed parallel beta-helix repeat-containing protein [Sedimentisphaerales bacterium]|nr:right-handed parallel beta-helix repeat-containing protein [Sedimentisphaerales bacterium]